MAGTQGLTQDKVSLEAHTLVAGVSDEIDLVGGTLAGILLEGDVTSTSFTITVARKAGGTFVTVKDPLAAGADISYTLAGTATGYYPISPLITAGFRYCKINFGSSETPTIYVAKRSME